MARREAPEINGGSMADIAFMLLIFFLVATTMNVDSGIMRKLPPIVEDTPEDIIIKDRNVFVVLINSNDQLLVENEILNINQLKDKAKEFIANKANLDNLPEKKRVENIPYFGTQMVSKQVISLQNDRGTKYETYVTVQNELTQAYNELRDELAMGKWSKTYAQLEKAHDKDKMKAIRKIYPMRISEAEPKNIGE